jgi:hypothetical protein
MLPPRRGGRRQDPQVRQPDSGAELLAAMAGAHRRHVARSDTKFGTDHIDGEGRGFWPFHYVLLNGKELETTFVSRNELKAIISPDAIRDVGMYLVTVKSRGEPIAQSYPAPFVVGGVAPETAQAPVTVP